MLFCTTIRSKDATDTLEVASQAPGCNRVHAVHKPWLLSFNGSPNTKICITADTHVRDLRAFVMREEQHPPLSVNAIFGDAAMQHRAALSASALGCDAEIGKIGSQRTF